MGESLRGKDIFAAFAESVAAATPPMSPVALVPGRAESFDVDAGQHLKLLLNVQA